MEKTQIWFLANFGNICKDESIGKKDGDTKTYIARYEGRPYLGFVTGFLLTNGSL